MTRHLVLNVDDGEPDFLSWFVDVLPVARSGCRVHQAVDAIDFAPADEIVVPGDDFAVPDDEAVVLVGELEGAHVDVLLCALPLALDVALI